MAKRPAKATGRELIEMPVNGSSDAPDVVKKVKFVLETADEDIDNCIRNKDPHQVFVELASAFSSRHASDIHAIELCYQADRRWKEFGVDGEFQDYARDETGKGVETIRRYAHIGRMMNEVVPAKYRQTLWCRPIRNLIAIAQAVNEHGNFSDDEWHVLARCVNGQEVRLNLDEFLAKERKPTNRLIITMDREGGLTASKRNKKEPIGMLRLEPGNELVAEAVQRIIASSGILEI